MQSPDRNSRIIAGIFHRRGGEGKNCRLFGDFTPWEQELVLHKIDLREDEQPIVAHIPSDTSWAVITTHRLLRLNSEGVDSVELDDIKRVTHDMGPTLHRGKLKATDFCELTVETMDDRVIDIDLESGPCFVGLWKALQWVSETAGKERRQAAA